MAFNRCTSCDTTMSSRNTYTCEYCGATICPACMDETNAHCPHCNAKMIK